MTSSPRTVVVGAGITGLVLARDLVRAGAEVTVLEAAPRVGGVIATFEREGFRFEDGPHTVLASAACFTELCGELGLEERLVRSTREASRRWLWHRGRLRALPRGPLSLAASELLSARAKLRLASEPLRRLAGPEPAEEPTLESFLEERLGREATRTLAGAFVRGVYASEIGELGAESAFPELVRGARRHGGLVRAALAARRERARRSEPGPGSARAPGRGGVVSLAGGLGELVRALARELGPRLRTDAPVTALERTGETWRVTAGGATLEATRVVLALPAPEIAQLVARLDPPPSALAALVGVRHADLTVVHLGLEGRCLPRGFGFLVPPDDAGDPAAPRVLGTLFASNVFPDRAPEGCSAVTSLYASAALEDLGESARVERAREDLARATGRRAPPVRVARSRRWPRALPRYGVGHRARVAAAASEIASALPGLYLAGNWLDGVSVPDRIRAARALAARLSGAEARSGELQEAPR